MRTDTSQSNVGYQLPCPAVTLSFFALVVFSGGGLSVAFCGCESILGCLIRKLHAGNVTWLKARKLFRMNYIFDTQLGHVFLPSAMLIKHRLHVQLLEFGGRLQQNNVGIPAKDFALYKGPTHMGLSWRDCAGEEKQLQPVAMQTVEKD